MGGEGRGKLEGGKRVGWVWWTHFDVGLVGPVDDHVDWLDGWLAVWWF